MGAIKIQPVIYGWVSSSTDLDQTCIVSDIGVDDLCGICKNPLDEALKALTLSPPITAKVPHANSMDAQYLI